MRDIIDAHSGQYKMNTSPHTTHIDNLLEDGAEADGERVGLLLEQIVPLLGALETLLHARQRPATCTPVTCRIIHFANESIHFQ